MPPEDVRRLVDIEADLDEGLLSQVRFGRRRFLRNLGLALFGVTTGAILATQEAAEARKIRGGCNRAPTCKSCNNGTCSSPGCEPAGSDGNPGCCWTAYWHGTCYQCCDYYEYGKLCVCPRLC
jgi:hypothetical protein